MAYTLQALIAEPHVLQETGIAKNKFVRLSSMLSLYPLTSTRCEELGLPFLPLTDAGCLSLPEKFTNLLTAASVKGKIAYVEAEYFGGAGAQASVLFANSRQVGEPLVSNESINLALRFLGVVAIDNKDEFESVGLNAHRKTELWC